jgi:hypothetical protein
MTYQDNKIVNSKDGAKDCTFNQLPHFTNKIPFDITQLNKIQLDAIFVPTIREQSTFITLIEMYSEMTQHLWIMPTKNAIPFFFNSITLPPNVELIPSSRIESEHRLLLERNSSNNPTRKIADDYDIPSKRNLALKISRNKGYDTILLLDDDITIEPDTSILLSRIRNTEATIGGCCIHDFPDVSTIEHVERYVTGRRSKTMPGGNCMVINIKKISGFFPYLYNDDWFFSVWNTRNTPGLYVGDAYQTPHFPWHFIQRVRFEEFGDTIINGLLGKNDKDLHSDLFIEDYWANELELRRNYLNELFSETSENEFQKAILAALYENNKYTPLQCCNTWKFLCHELEEE